MARELPQIEDSSLTAYIRPKGIYLTFSADEEYLEFTRKWGLNTATTAKTRFWYKESYYKREVELVGYEQHARGYQTAIIRFHDGTLSCINPMYLKDMQKSSFGEELDEEALTEQVKQTKQNNAHNTQRSANQTTDAIALPNGKVSFTGTLECFDVAYNSFTEKDDAIILWRDVELDNGTVKLPYAWCGYSKTLEKLGLVAGDRISCVVEAVMKDFKDIAKVKVNRPSKIEICT